MGERPSKWNWGVYSNMFGLREKIKEILPLKKLENSTLEHCEYGLGKCHAAWFLQNSDG